MLALIEQQTRITMICFTDFRFYIQTNIIIDNFATYTAKDSHYYYLGLSFPVQINIL